MQETHYACQEIMKILRNHPMVHDCTNSSLVHRIRIGIGKEVNYLDEKKNTLQVIYCEYKP